MKKYLTLSIVLMIVHSVFGQIPVDSIKAILQHEISAKRSKSIIVGIIDSNGRVVISEGILSDENPVQPDANTLYEIGSITKVFTSLVLADMGLKQQLNLTDPISKFLPKNLQTPARNGKEISLLHLSTHRAGFPRNAYNIDPKNLDNPFADYTVKHLYDYISTFELSRDIDSKWQYSNIGYSLLGHILSIVAHKNYETLVKQNICQPLGMKSTVISLTPSLKRNMAIGHSENGRPVMIWDLPLAGGGGFHSNVNDLLTFAAANLGLKQSDIYPAMELSHLERGKKDGNDSYMAMGWTLWNDNGKHILFKDGGTGGCRTFLGIDKKNKIGVVVLSNSNNSVTDIGLHLLDSASEITKYKYPWKLLDTLRTSFKIKGLDSAIQLYHRLKASNNSAFVFNEYQLNHLGHELRRENKIKDALQIFELNLREYPKSVLVYESLGETYKRQKDKKKAIGYFEKALELEPNNVHWKFLLEKLKG